MNRANNAARNIVFGGILRIYQIIVPFIMRTVMIYLMGAEYAGLNTLFTSVLQVLNLAELGVGAAMVYSMYQPIVDEDSDTICALLKLYRTYYRVIGGFIAIVGVCLTPVIPRLIKGEVPGNLNVYALYLLNLAATVLTYWLFAYKNSLLQAHQRNDVASKVTLITNTVQYGLQFLVLWLFHNYYLFVIVMLATQAVTNIVTAVVASRMYPQYKPKGTLPGGTVKSINQRIKDLFTAKLGATIVNSADTVVISAFLGLTILTMYQNYYFIMTAVMGILSVVFGSCLAGVGNSMITESIEKNYNDFRTVTLLINWIVTICMCCFATMYQPFITLWVGAEFTFDMTVVALFCVYFYLVIMQQIIGMYKDAAGIWHQDRFRPLIAAMVNLTLNLLMVRFYGIYAIILSTIISYLLVAVPWMVHNVFQYVFKRGWRSYASDMIAYFVAAGAITAFCRLVSILTEGLDPVLQLVTNFIICLVVSNLLLLLLFRKNRYFNQMADLVDRITKYKLTKLIHIFKT